MLKNQELKMFGTDGVRGKAGKLLTASVAMKIAMAIGIYFRKHSKTNKILIGKDTRKSGYMIENAIVSGLTAIGYDVIQIGPMPTPAIAFLTEDMRCDAGIMISASHNEYGDNGIKCFDSNGDKLDENIEYQIEQIYFNDELIEQNQKIDKEIGSAQRIDDVIGRYIVHIKNSFPQHLTLGKLRIILDCANGASYKVAPTIFHELGAEIIVINDKPNGFNINDNCGALYPQKLAEYVKKYRADLGFSFDGDADRLVVVDENGDIVDGDKLLGALANFIHSKNGLKNNGCVATLMSNKALIDYLENKNIKTYRCSIGDKFILNEFKKSDLNFGGEQSGHIIFGDFAKTGDGLVSALQVSALLIQENKKASKVLNPFELYPQILVNLKIKEKVPFEKIVGLEDILKDIRAKGLRDLIRYSGTEDKLRILLEGKDNKIVKNEMQRLVDFFKKNKLFF